MSAAATGSISIGSTPEGNISSDDLRAQGNELFSKGNYTAAILIYDDAIKRNTGR